VAVAGTSSLRLLATFNAHAQWFNP
jgi:hypothetical protein